MCVIFNLSLFGEKMKKSEFFLQIITPITLLLSAVWFAATLDKQIALASQSIFNMSREIKSFEVRQEKLNQRQDKQLEDYRKYSDEKIDIILNKLQVRS